MVEYAGMRTEFKVPYSGEFTDSRRLDLFFPEYHANGCAMLFVHGGGWSGGSPRQWHPVCEHFARRGYVAASAGYRLMPKARFPDPVEDVRLAMAFFRDHADEYEFDPNKVAAVGSSAGGYLVAMLATIGPDDDLGVTAELSARDTRPNAVVCYCPVTDLHEAGRRGQGARKFLGATEEEDPELYCTASPIDRVSGAEPPFLFLQGDADPTTPQDEVAALCEKLRQSGDPHEMVVLRGAVHGFGYGVSTPPQEESVRHVERFLARRFHVVDLGTLEA
jgi:acetyl esterase/lipase